MTIRDILTNECAGIILYRDSISDEQDFLSCKTKEDFEHFIKEHPSSSYVDTAQKRIKALTPAEQQSEAPAPIAERPSQTHKTHSPVTTVPVIRERVEVIETPSTIHPKKADNRTNAKPSEPQVAKPVSTPVSQPSNDIVYDLSDPDENIINNAAPTTGSTPTHNAARQQIPQRTFRTGGSAVSVRPNGPSGYRGGGRPTGGQRNGGSRSGGSATHRHSH